MLAQALRASIRPSQVEDTRWQCTSRTPKVSSVHDIPGSRTVKDCDIDSLVVLRHTPRLFERCADSAEAAVHTAAILQIHHSQLHRGWSEVGLGSVVVGSVAVAVVLLGPDLRLGGAAAAAAVRHSNPADRGSTDSARAPGLLGSVAAENGIDIAPFAAVRFVEASCTAVEIVEVAVIGQVVVYRKDGWQLGMGRVL